VAVKLTFKKLDQFLEDAIKAKVFPGCAVGIVGPTEIYYSNSYGHLQYEKDSPIVSNETIYDLASLTKVIATTTSILQLIERGRLNHYDYLGQFFSDLPAEKEEITINHLLTHSSGFQAIVELWKKDLSFSEKFDYILNLELKAEVGKTVNYSDPNFILLGEIVRLVTGKRLDEYAQENIFTPLAMNNTTFNPLTELAGINKEKVAPTEKCDLRKKLMQGEVHDENAYYFDGVSGHAGLFSNLEDLLIFLQMILNKGKLNGDTILSRQIMDKLQQDWTKNLNESRGLGWDLINNFRSSGGLLLADGSFGHTGFTGTSLWIDPVHEIGYVLLSNRVHPTRENNKIITLRPRFHNLAASLLEKNGVIS